MTALSGLGAPLLNALAPLTTTLSYGRVGAGGAAEVRLTFDHRVLGSAAAAQCWNIWRGFCAATCSRN